MTGNDPWKSNLLPLILGSRLDVQPSQNINLNLKHKPKPIISLSSQRVSQTSRCFGKIVNKKITQEL